VVNFVDSEMDLNADSPPPQKKKKTPFFYSGVCLELEVVLNLKYCDIYMNSLIAVIHSVVRIPDFV